ncbi:MAG: olfactomedin domain-containing protein [Xanthomonadaceae bacterium]|nr:olfactomedin domain-containing protein [Xanthomonadaceae bacterium]
MLRAPETLNLGGIDGLYSWQGSLVAIQNGISPNRILRLDLDESGTSVESIAPLSVALPEFETPTFGAMVDNRLVYLAASHWDKVDENGLPLDPPLPAIPVLSSAVDEAENLVVGKEMLEQLKQQGRAVTPGG